MTPVIDGSMIMFTKTGVYTLAHADGSTTAIEVKDATAPIVSVDFSGFNPVPNVASALPKITVTDGYDGVISEFTASVDGIAATSVTFSDYGIKILKVFAEDKSGNKVEKAYTLECLPESDAAMSVGTVVTLDSDFFVGVGDLEEYNYNFTLIETLTQQSGDFIVNKTLHAIGFEIRQGGYYEVTGVATNARGEKVRQYKLYYDKDFYKDDYSLLTFDYVSNGNYEDTDRDVYLIYEVFQLNGRQFVTAPANARTEMDINGNGKLAISSVDENIWSWRFALYGEKRSGTLYFDVSFEHAEDEWLFEIVKDTVILRDKDAGRYSVHIDANEDQSDISYRFGVNGPKLTVNKVYLDNFLFVPD